jgi:hypothetical protein
VLNLRARQNLAAPDGDTNLSFLDVSHFLSHLSTFSVSRSRR